MSDRPHERPPADASKAMWRAWARARRDSLDLERIDAGIVRALEGMPEFRAARCVLTYAAFGSEANPAALLETHAGREKRWLLTRTGDLTNDLSIHDARGALERHRFGFLQPAPDSPAVDPREVDLVLVPGVAFDVGGTRLGYGRGFYDRLLPRLAATAPRVGVVPAALVVPRLPRDAWDVNVTHVATEDGVTAVRE